VLRLDDDVGDGIGHGAVHALDRGRASGAQRQRYLQGGGFEDRAGRGGGFKVRGSTTLRVLRTNDPLLVIPGGARRTQCTKQQFAASESGLNERISEESCLNDNLSFWRSISVR
jgi:hypothetical protein